MKAQPGEGKLGHGLLGRMSMVAAVAVALAMPAAAQDYLAKTVTDVAADSKDHTTLVAALEAADYADALRNPGPFTVFAPTNEAFAKLAKAAPATYQAVLADPALLAKVLTYHVVAGDIKSAQAIGVAQQNGTVNPLEGEPISLSLKDGKLTLNGSATVVTADILATNGVIHVIDTVIVPPSLSA